MLNAALNLINFDPEILDVVLSFFAVAGKYGFYFGIAGYVLRMLIKAGTGKQRFL